MEYQIQQKSCLCCSWMLKWHCYFGTRVQSLATGWNLVGISSPWNLFLYPENVFHLISYLVFRWDGLLINRIWTKWHWKDCKIWEFWVGSTVLIFLMDGKAVCRFVPGLSFFMGCLTSWITRQEKIWNAVLKIEGVQLAKNLLSTSVMWSSSLLYICSDQEYFSLPCVPDFYLKLLRSYQLYVLPY